MGLPTNARARYEADGFYLQASALLPDDLISRAIAGQDALCRGSYDTGIPPQNSYWNPGDDPGKLVKIEMSQVANRAIWDLVTHPAIGELAAAITGAEWVQIWWTQLLIKPPAGVDGVGSPSVGWHQDRHYWQSWEEGSEIFTAWVALSDVTAEAGAMRFVRGSHRWGLRNLSDFYGQDHEAQREQIEVPAGAAWEEAPAVLSPGGVSFHHNLTYHGSGPNRSGQPRRSFALHLRTEKSRPVDDARQGLTRFIDDPGYCPVIYGRMAPGG
jgi:Phytanoyl-CoA dioxygenase (PhyH)